MIIFYIIGIIVLLYGIIFDILPRFKFYRSIRGGVWVLYKNDQTYIYSGWERFNNKYNIGDHNVIRIENYT